MRLTIMGASPSGLIGVVLHIISRRQKKR
jgi:hypothetical protein